MEFKDLEAGAIFICKSHVINYMAAVKVPADDVPIPLYRKLDVPEHMEGVVPNARNLARSHGTMGYGIYVEGETKVISVEAPQRNP